MPEPEEEKSPAEASDETGVTTDTAPSTAASSTDFFAAERRRSPRQKRSTSAWLSAASGQRNGNGLHVQVRDLSLHGVGYVADAEPRKNDTHWMVIAEQSLRLSTRLRVIAFRRRDDGKWDVGAEFF